MDKKERKTYRKNLVEKYRRVEYEKSHDMFLDIRKDLLEDYFREVLHPRYIELTSKYPNVSYWVRKKLKEKYPSTKMTNEEYRKMWSDAAKTTPFLDEVFKARDEVYRGAYIPVPFRKGS